MPERTPFAAVVPDTEVILNKDSFTYSVPDELSDRALVGARVRVPFGPQSLVGYVVARESTCDFPNPKAIHEVLDELPLLLPQQIELAKWISARYMAPLSEVVKAMVPSGVREISATGRKRGPRTMSAGVIMALAEQHPETAPTLTNEQATALHPIVSAIEDQAHVKVLLHGVTGSGKTEVYLAAIAKVLELGRQALVLIPEIALTPQTIRRFAARFPGRTALLHSGLTEAERASEWRRIRAGDASVVVGSRSAVFAPLERLGIVVIDEEDSNAYKQDRLPRYHAVDVGLRLGELMQVPVVLGSATPRIETFYRAHTQEMMLVTLPARISNRDLPAIDVIDLREELNNGNRLPISVPLQEAIRETFIGGGQSIVFLNRRGTATVVVCFACGEALTCEQCSVAMVYHHARQRCDCHYCGASIPMPQTCPSCDSADIRGLGMGTERLEAQIKDLFPKIRLLRMDKDTVKQRDAYFTIFESFRRGEADCMIGTQMVAKGWDLEGVELVGIVNADAGLHFPDYRSAEATFNLLTQVAGRTGRGGRPAKVILQTYSPQHYAIRYAQSHDYAGFAHEEIRVRKRQNFPPFAQLIECTYAHEDDAKAQQTVKQIVGDLAAALPAGIEVLGPSPAFLHKLRGEYRWQFLVKGIELHRLAGLLPQTRGWSIDVDPMQ